MKIADLKSATPKKGVKRFGDAVSVTPATIAKARRSAIQLQEQRLQDYLLLVCLTLFVSFCVCNSKRIRITFRRTTRFVRFVSGRFVHVVVHIDSYSIPARD